MDERQKLAPRTGRTPGTGLDDVPTRCELERLLAAGTCAAPEIGRPSMPPIQI